MKKFLVSALAFTLFLGSVTAFAGSAAKSIDVLMGQVNVVVDGAPSDKETMLYDGRTYVQLRDAAELIGLEVNWDEKTSTASLEKAKPVTIDNLIAAMQGEVNASAKYKAFAEVAEKEGYKKIARVFRATSDSEMQHARVQFMVAKTFGVEKMPVAEEFTVGTTAENLQTAIDGETYEFSKMYPVFVEQATKDNILDARGIFAIASSAEMVHAKIYKDLLDNINNPDYKEYEVIYRCPTCGDILTSRPGSCPICGDEGEDLIEYK